MTGLELFKIFELQVDKAYTGYWDNTKANRIFLRALIQAARERYKGLASQPSYDDLRGFIKVNRTFVPTTGNLIYTDVTGSASPNIQDYYDLLHVSAQFNETLYNVNVVSATNATPIVVSLEGLNNVRTTDRLVFTGAVGNTALNATYYAKQIKTNTFALYLDEFFQTPSTGNGVYTANTATIARFWYEPCQRYFSDRKGTQYGGTSPSNPKFEQQNQSATSTTMLLFHPLNVVCNEITIDYITQPPVVIDVADNVVDLETWYDKSFLYFVVEQAALLAAQQIRDDSLYATTANQIASK